MLYRVTLKTTTDIAPLAIESKRDFYMEADKTALDNFFAMAKGNGWEAVAVPVAVRTIDSIETAFKRTIELDTDM